MTEAPSVHYRVAVVEPARHLAEIELRVAGAAELGDSIDLEMAAWCPGSYLIRDYARHVRDLEVTGEDGEPLAVRKVAKHTWRVDRAGAAELAVRYRVYGHDLTVRTNHIDDSHAFLHGPATYLYLPALRDRPCRVDVALPDPGDWHVATGLERDGDGYRAADLDELLDCPLHLGRVSVREFEAAARPFELAVWGYGPGGVADLDRLVTDLCAIIETHAARLGGLPCDRYTFILMLSDGAYGGLEHRSSSANLGTPHAFASREGYEKLLELLSHEFFHIWNGKRIYPETFARFDYRTETYTRCLWVVEGVTSYLDRLTVRRADRIELKRYFEKLLEEWARLQHIPGRHRHSLEESSFDAWIKLYKPDESNLNTTVSYYLKGSLVMLALDLEIRARSGGARSLDDVVARLWADYGSRGLGYPEDRIEEIFAAGAGFALEEFFARFIRGREDPDLGAALGRVGLELQAGYEPSQTADGQEPVWLGIGCQGHRATVAQVIDDGPGAAAGLSPRDEVIAVNGYRTKGKGELAKRLAAYRPGDRVELAVFRRARLTPVVVELASPPPTHYELRVVAEPDPAQRKLFAAWMGAELPDPGPVANFTTKEWI